MSAADWRHAALDVVEQLARSQPYLTSDDVWGVLGVGAHDHRAMGPVMQRAARLGLVEPTAAYRPSARRRGPQRVWRSLVYKA